jgi:hypothetical protein
MRHIIFNCSPSLGILDNWLPVIFFLKNKLPDVRFIFVAPVPNVIDKSSNQGVLIEIAEEIFDTIVFKSHTDEWLFSSSFSESVLINDRSKVWLIILLKKILTRYDLKFVKPVVSKILKAVNNVLFKEYVFSFDEIDANKSVVLFDIYEASKEYNRDILNIFSDSFKFSIFHALNVNGIRINSKKNISYIAPPSKVVVYAFSKKEVDFYRSRYLLGNESIRVYGVTRHDPMWVKYLLFKENEKSISLFEKYIFVISRPIGPMVSRNKKIESILDIKKIAKKFNYKIVVKLHPKEIGDGTFEEVLGVDNFNNDWMYSNLHSFTLGSNCELAVSFYSGVPIDMIILGVPTIERLDLTGVDKYEGDAILTDENGEPCSEFRHLGLVLGASDYEQMEKHVYYIMNDRMKAVGMLKKRYLKILSYFDGVNDVVSDEIVDVLKISQ